jgi:hypothetical protein
MGTQFVKPITELADWARQNAQGWDRISKVMQEMGRKGGKKGAKMRAEALTPEQRSQIARKAAKTRWAKVKKKR